MNRTINKSAIKVITTEAEALITLANKLPNDFEKVVKLILGIKGHVIISGVGKSGHIGRKISATLASTGTPSHFVHATEASHGDLGALTDNDVCLLISNSGETTELADLISHTQRFSIPLVAISSNPRSSLAKASNFKLCLPQATEACSIGLAPTTSTTMALALGDALAVTLMQERKFSPEHFKILHPGGKLGAQVIKVKQLMHTGKKMPLVKPNSSMPNTLIEMTSKGFGVAIIEENNAIRGVITDGDLRRSLKQPLDLRQTPIVDLMSLQPMTAKADMLAAKALQIMEQNKINALVVVDRNHHPVGAINMHDLLRAGVL